MRRGRHFSYANVMSTLAVFLAVSGGSVAIAGIPDPDSVDSSKVVDDSLESVDLRDDAAVKARDVVNATLGSADLGTDSVASAEIAGAAVRAGEIANGEVGSAEIADNAVGASEVALDAIGTSELAPSAVGSIEVANESLTGDDIGASIDASELRADAIYRVAGDAVEFDDVDAARNADYAFAEASASCSEDGGSGELISGTGKWIGDGNPEAGEELVISELRLNQSTETATVMGGNDSGDPHRLVAEAICLAH